MLELYITANQFGFIPNNLSISWKTDPYLWMCELQKWLREVHGLNIHVALYSLIPDTYGFELMGMNYQTFSTLRTGYNSEHFYGEIIEYKSYEEALELALMKGLKLIK